MIKVIKNSFIKPILKKYPEFLRLKNILHSALRKKLKIKNNTCPLHLSNHVCNFCPTKNTVQLMFGSFIMHF